MTIILPSCGCCEAESEMAFNLRKKYVASCSPHIEIQSEAHIDQARKPDPSFCFASAGVGCIWGAGLIQAGQMDNRARCRRFVLEYGCRG